METYFWTRAMGRIAFSCLPLLVLAGCGDSEEPAGNVSSGGQAVADTIASEDTDLTLATEDRGAAAPVLEDSDEAAGQPKPSTAASNKVPLAQRSPIVTPLPEPDPIDVLKNKPLYKFNEREVDVYLRYLSKAEPDPVKRLLRLARQNIGQPYEIYLLGEFPYETYDPDPMYCLSKSDCVTFSEHTYAMAFARDWASFFQILQRLRYKDGQVGMLTRNHETVCDWDRNNGWLFTDVTQKLADGKAWTPMHIVWRPSRFFRQFGIGQDLPDVKLTDAYIPRASIPKVLDELRDGDFVNIIRGSSGSEWCGHVGIIGHGPDGEVHLIHSAQPAVREQPLMDYLQRNRSTLGMKFLRLKDNPQRVVDEELGRRAGLAVAPVANR